MSRDVGVAVDRALLGLTCALAALLACFKSTDGDLGFHLATGRYILAHGEIPARNVLSFTQPDHPWLLHQWLPATLFELVHRSHGFVGLGVLKMAVCALMFGLVFRTARVVGASAWAAAIACALAACASAFRFELRPLLFTHLTLAAFLWCIAEGSRSRRPIHWLVAAVIVAAVGLQLHAGGLDALIACAALGIGCLVEPWRARSFGTVADARSGVRPFVVLAVVGTSGLVLAALALALYHPHGAATLLFPLDMAGDAYLHEHLVEFRAPWRLPFGLLSSYWLVLALVVTVCAVRVRHVHAALLLVTLVFVVLSLRHARLVFGFAIVSAPLLALGVDAALAALRPKWPAFGFVLLAGVLVLTPLDTFRKLPFGFGTVDVTWPMGLFAEFETLEVRGEGFVSDGWAGPMLGMFYPRYHAYWDNRFEAYSREFFRRGYQDVRYGKPGWDAAFDRYGVQWALLRYTRPTEADFQRGAPNLRQHLARDPRYRLVSFDDQGALFVRVDGANAGAAERYGISGLDPDRGSFVGKPRQALGGLRSLLPRVPDSARAHALAAVAAKDAGQIAAARAWFARAVALDPAAPWNAQIRAMVER